MSNGKYSQRMLAAAGSLSGLTAAHVATEAALIHVSDRPLSIKFTDGDGYEQQWDIDGAGAAEFSFVVVDGIFTDQVNVTSGGLNGRQFVAINNSTDNIKALASSFTVGAGADFTTGTYRNIIETSSIDNATHSVLGPDLGDGFNPNGSNLVGFRFDAGSGFRYGYAEWVYDLGAFGTATGLTITQWWYDDAGGSVHVQNPPPAVPEPNTLALLALGAAGLVSYRAARGQIRAAAGQAVAS